MQCAQHSSYACLILSLRMDNTDMSKGAASLAAESLRYLPANTVVRVSSHSQTLDVVSNFVALRYVNVDVFYESEPG